MGRPTKYKAEYCKEIIKFFDKPLYIFIDVEKMSASGAVKIVKERVPNAMPTFEGFARSIGVIHDTLINWTKDHKDFLGAYNTCKGVQKEFIFTHGLLGGYNANITKFFAINNLGMNDRTEVKQEIDAEVKGYGLAFDLSKKPDEL